MRQSEAMILPGNGAALWCMPESTPGALLAPLVRTFAAWFTRTDLAATADIFFDEVRAASVYTAP